MNQYTLNSRRRRARLAAKELNARGNKPCAPVPQEEKSHRIALGIAVLRARARPGASFSFGEIAAWADCSDQAIRDIEAKAMAVLRPLLDDFQHY